ncbi:histidine phosphatase family protein [Nocardia sp. ET3-3]|uniref:phosphoglycerate mutase (2,3-diphosphoglycerate-dependent) n=1 Tax=Nocardia terrae TaxID=2675851 RepID=A0A7K1UPR6_9NOCA|nr:histidine phosphatase family protein [Nocardia terrae]MVU76330.1 histidine phosphatase family protein [Nocardia terrae]
MHVVGPGLESLTMVRHGQSVVNAAPYDGGMQFITGTRDADVQLTELGVTQATAAGKRLAEISPAFDLVMCSPYVRTRETARLALASLTPPPIVFDERLRDRETGILFGLTRTGIMVRYPREHRELRRLGSFYHRPPGGESWPDVALRLRSVLGEMHGHVLVFTHDIAVVLTRYLFGELDEADISAQTGAEVRNASITRWERTDSGLRRTMYNDTAHLD